MNISDLYRQRRDRVELDLAKAVARSKGAANQRLVVFGMIVVTVSVAVDGSPLRLFFWIVTALLLVAFVFLVRRSRKTAGSIRALNHSLAANQDGIARAERDWDRLSESPPHEEKLADHAFAEDLDIYGHASLMQLLSTARTSFGRRLLAGWLLNPGTPEEIVGRQEAVRELAPQLDFRQALEVTARQVGHVAKKPLDAFLQWAETAETVIPTAKRAHVIAWSGVVLGALSVWLLTLRIFGRPVGAFWILPVLVNVLITVRFHRRIHRTFNVVGACEGAFQRYAEMLGLLGRHEFVAPELRKACEPVHAGRSDASVELRRLHRLVHLSDLRLSSMHFLFQILTLWDLHVITRLDSWKGSSGGVVRRWLQTIGEVEALSALGSLAHDNPSWRFPAIDRKTDRISARGVAHPMLRDDLRIHNVLEIGPKGTFVFVTGSNMSGKSTLLRAMGVNIVLAQAGSVVCANAMQLPPVRLFTSMRINDSLERGVSYFMAGVLRLKTIVDAARGHDPADGVFLYLLDEILQGTNTGERQIAVRNVLEQLLSLNALGAVTTHDLTLSDTDTLIEARRSIHFIETVDPGKSGTEATMTFDYKLRPGVATSTNALRLLEVMGVIPLTPDTP